MVLAFILIISLSFIYTLYIQIFSTDSSQAKKISRIFFITSAIGLLSSIASFLIYYEAVHDLGNKELISAISDAFMFFAYPVCILAFFVIILTVIVHFTGKKISAVIPSVCHLASLLVLIFSLIYSSWSQYEEFSLNLYIEIIGCSISLAVLLSAAFSMSRLAKNLSDKDYVYSRLHRHDSKHKKAEERRRIKETKKRIKQNTKKSC